MLKITAFFLVLSLPVKADPYFRLLDPKNPQISAGALVDPVNPGNSAATTQLSLITHSTKDGCLFPKITCQPWSPLSVGFAANSGRFLLSAGPSINLAPISRQFLLKGLNLFTKVDEYVGLKTTLSPEPHSENDISIAFGPSYVVSPTEKFKGYFRIFSGVAWNF